MPTISQLPAATAVNAADAVPISQGGVARAASLGTLLAEMQPAIMVDSPCVLGRTSLGRGGPEQIALGKGLVISEGTLSVTGSDLGALPTANAIAPTDQMVISHGGNPKLAPASLLRGLFSAGLNISIDPSGVISASLSSGGDATGSAYKIGALPSTSIAAAQDLVGISQAGTDRAISYANLLNGQTIDMAQAAGPAADGDTLWVAQGSNTMVRQSLGTIWAWIAGRLPSARAPVVEVTADTTLDGTVHNGRLLVCSQPVTLTPIATNMGNGFRCEVVNVSTGNVTLGAGILTSTGSPNLPPRQAAVLRCLVYSGGTVVHAAIPGDAGSATPPGAPTALTSVAVAADSVTLSWQAPISGGLVSGYIVQYRVSGAGSWIDIATASASTTWTVAGLTQTTAYDFAVKATNSSGPGTASGLLTVTTASNGTVPGQVSALSAASASTTSIAINWSAPISGGAVANYTVQYRPVGSTGWTMITGITTTAQVATGLSPSTTYEITVFASNGAGNGALAALVTATTASPSGAVTAITWNLVPSGTYARGTGSIGANAHVTPETAAVQFGFSTSATTPPAAWTVGIHVNTDLWGAYVPGPTAAGTWYAWVEGMDGSCPTVYPTPFTVS